VVQGAAAFVCCGAGDYGWAAQESKLNAPVTFSEGRAAGQQR